jgi:hypothetical protein
MKLIKLVDLSNGHRLADGCVLPDGQLAVAWLGEHKTHGTYPSIEVFEKLQRGIPGRSVQAYEPDHTEICLGIHNYTFQLVRGEDVTGISGTGIVAVGCDFMGAGCVLQWVCEIKSTFWYPSLQVVEALHGHGGKTRVVVDSRT